MSKISYPQVSAYSSTPQSSWAIGRYVDKMIPADSTDSVIQIPPQYQYRPDKMAYDYYGDSGYWWVFMSKNPGVIIDPVWGFVTGLVITIPSKANVLKAAPING